MIAEKQKRGSAAIASRKAAELYGLNILSENIQDQTGNTTRFFVIAKTGVIFPASPAKISVLFETKNIPAALYKSLGAFATHGINLVKIESLPSFKNPFTYIFWVDFEGKETDLNVQTALTELAYFTESVQILGSY